MKMLSRNLRITRNDKGFTQDMVAEHLGIKRQTYSAYERNKSLPDALTLNKLSKLFDVSVDVLLGSDEPATVNTKTTPNEGWQDVSADEIQNQDNAHMQFMQFMQTINLLSELNADAIEQLTPLINDMHRLPEHRRFQGKDNKNDEHIKKVASESRIILKNAGATTFTGDSIIK